MLALTTVIVSETAARLRGESGVNQYLQAASLASAVELPMLEDQQVVEGHLSVEIAEKSPLRYPQIYVYCEKVSNTLKEKFRTFSGSARMALEVRASHERSETVGLSLQSVVDSVTASLDGSRGEWREGVFYAGGYEITYSPVKAGGKQYVKGAKITFDLDVSLN